MHIPDFHVAERSPCCGVGRIEVLRGLNGALFCRCDECLALWKHPEDCDSSAKALPDREALAGRSATADEIKAYGWWRYVVDPGWY